MREQVKFNTSVIVADLAVNATLEAAYGKGNKTIFEARATQTTISEVLTKQAKAYKKMMTDLTFDKDQVLEYMRHNLIKDYSTGKVAIGINY